MVETSNTASSGINDDDSREVSEMEGKGNRSTKFTISAPASPNKDTEEQETGEEGVMSETKDGAVTEEIQSAGDDGMQSDEKQQENASDLMFKKKDVRRSRTQSFQSVLSSASLKSLKQQYTNPQTQVQGQLLQRNNSFISTNGNTNNVKNFQSFIQAPVLSSISNLRTNGDDIEIGQRLPFSGQAGNSQNDVSGNSNTNKTDGLSSALSSTDEDDTTDQDTMMQQQKLTLNALRKLTLSPMPIINSSESLPQRKPLSRKSSAKLTEKPPKRTEPYQPAEVDLSSFASLTRQPKLIPNEGDNSDPSSNSDEVSPNAPKSANGNGGSFSNGTTNKSNTPKRQPVMPSLIERSDSSIASSSGANEHPASMLAAQRYHNEVHQNHLQNVRQHMKDSVGVNPGGQVAGPTLLNDLRRNSGQNIQLQQPVARPQQQPYVPNNGKQKNNKQLQQINNLRSPMYIPAVLRMTQDLSRSNSATGSPVNDSFQPHINDSSSTQPSGSPEITPSTQNHQYQHPIHEKLAATSSRGSFTSADSLKSTDSPSPPLMSPTGPFTISKRKYESILRQAPTRRHWVKDESVNKCGIPTCTKVFNFFERRHHCRKCGGIYCKEHTSHYLYINHLAQFTTGGRGTLSKVCDNCIEEYNEFMRHEFGVSINPIHHKKVSSPQPSHIHTKQNTGKLGTIPNGSHIKDINNPNLPDSTSTNRNDQPVGSVPANWSWSSF